MEHRWQPAVRKRSPRSLASDHDPSLGRGRFLHQLRPSPSSMIHFPALNDDISRPGKYRMCDLNLGTWTYLYLLHLGAARPYKRTVGFGTAGSGRMCHCGGADVLLPPLSWITFTKVLDAASVSHTHQV